MTLIIRLDETTEAAVPRNKLGPPVFDAHALAMRLGIRRKTLWWLVLANKNIDGVPKLYTEQRILKQGGKAKRVLHVPCDPLKAIQKALLARFFVQREDTPAYVAAYVLGRSTLEAAQQHVGAAVKLSVDIKNFFPSTTRGMVRDYLRSEGFSDELISIISNLVTVPLVNKEGRAYSVLPQGSPTSAAIANRIAMAAIDAPLLESLPEGAVYTRYCDNLEVSFQRELSREEVDALLIKVRHVVEHAGYRLNHAKTKIERATSPTRAMRVLGITVNQHANIPSAKYRQLRMLVYQIEKFGLDHVAETSTIAQSRLDVPVGGALYASVLGELVYWNRINPERVGPLLAKLKEYKP